MFPPIDNKKAILLEQEKKRYVLYVAMLRYGGGTFQNTKYEWTSIRVHLEFQLILSVDNFQSQAEVLLNPKISPDEKERSQQLFDDLIVSPVSFSERINNMGEELYWFLYSLCFTRSEQSLELFVQKYPDAINCLSSARFNSLCVAAASNHLYDFMSFLCKQGKSIDEYAIEPFADHDIFDCIQTPFIAACHRIGYAFFWNKVTFQYSAERIATAIRILKLLISHDADPNKDYVCDDLSDQGLMTHLNDGGGYSIIEGLSLNDELLEKLSARGLDETVIFLRFLLLATETHSLFQRVRSEFVDGSVDDFTSLTISSNLQRQLSEENLPKLIKEIDAYDIPIAYLTCGLMLEGRVEPISTEGIGALRWKHRGKRTEETEHFYLKAAAADPLLIPVSSRLIWLLRNTSFTDFDANQLGQLQKESKLFVFYMGMKTYGSELITPPKPVVGRTTISTQMYLEYQLCISVDAFLREAGTLLEPKMASKAKDQSQQLYKELILSPTHSISRLSNELYSFVHTLCWVRAEYSLEIFIQKYPKVISSFSLEKFNSLCVAAAANHLYDFMRFLCGQGKSIDEYVQRQCIVVSPWDVHTRYVTQTPFIAASIRMAELFITKTHYTADRIAKVVDLLKLLIRHQADPIKPHSWSHLPGVSNLDRGQTIMESLPIDETTLEHIQSVGFQEYTPVIKYLLLLKGVSSLLPQVIDEFVIKHDDYFFSRVIDPRVELDEACFPELVHTLEDYTRSIANLVCGLLLEGRVLTVQPIENESITYPESYFEKRAHDAVSYYLKAGMDPQLKPTTDLLLWHLKNTSCHSVSERLSLINIPTPKQFKSYNGFKQIPGFILSMKNHWFFSISKKGVIDIQEDKNDQMVLYLERG